MLAWSYVENSRYARASTKSLLPKVQPLAWYVGFCLWIQSRGAKMRLLWISRGCLWSWTQIFSHRGCFIIIIWALCFALFAWHPICWTSVIDDVYFQVCSTSWQGVERNLAQKMQPYPPGTHMRYSIICVVLFLMDFTYMQGQDQGRKTAFQGNTRRKICKHDFQTWHKGSEKNAVDGGLKAKGG